MNVFKGVLILNKCEIYILYLFVFLGVAIPINLERLLHIIFEYILLYFLTMSG